MKIMAIVFFTVLVFGCIDLGRGSGNNSSQKNLSDSTNTTNITGIAASTNNTANSTDGIVSGNQTRQWRRTEPAGFGFSLEYPANMNASRSGSVFTARHDLDGTIGELIVVMPQNTLLVFGGNKDELLRRSPGKTASDFLIADENGDPVELLHNAYALGNLSTFSIERDAYVAEVPFRLKLSARHLYSGYAINIYVPERSSYIRVRILALDPEIAKNIRDRFLLSFRLD